MASDASSVRWGLPVWGGATIEPWCVVAQHCLSLDWMIPKASGGRFLSKTERAALKAFATFESPYPTNAEAEWMEAIVTRCHQARDAWRDASEKDAA